MATIMAIDRDGKQDHCVWSSVVQQDQLRRCRGEATEPLPPLATTAGQGKMASPHPSICRAGDTASDFIESALTIPFPTRDPPWIRPAGEEKPGFTGNQPRRKKENKKRKNTKTKTRASATTKAIEANLVLVLL